MKENVVLRVVAKLLIPLILLFALYIQLHGDYSPGGGFQAGIIFAAALVLYALIFGLDAAQQVVTPRAAHLLAAGGGLLYLAVGFWAVVAGGNFLEYKVLHEVVQTGEVIGIITIELGVGVTVTGVAVTLFYAFAGHQSRITDSLPQEKNRESQIRSHSDRVRSHEKNRESQIRSYSDGIRSYKGRG